MNKREECAILHRMNRISVSPPEDVKKLLFVGLKIVFNIGSSLSTVHSFVEWICDMNICFSSSNEYLGKTYLNGNLLSRPLLTLKIHSFMSSSYPAMIHKKSCLYVDKLYNPNILSKKNHDGRDIRMSTLHR